MKKLLFLLFFILSIGYQINAQGPPPPPSGHGSSNNQPSGGGAPIGGGLFILLTLAAGYGGKKVYDFKKQNLEE